MSIQSIWEQTRDFTQSGGDILMIITIVTFILWSLIFERFLYIKNEYPDYEKSVLERWNSRLDKNSWSALRVREQMVSEAGLLLYKRITLIKTLVAICPLLGLMGTVTGMINVFDVMGLVGNSNTRLMASGISLATIPTMAGMVASLSGLYFENLLAGKARKSKHVLAEKLSYE